MEISCWGSRGSIPVSGSRYLKYGGNTTCIEINTDSGHTIIVDAGTGIREMGNKLAANGKNACYLLFSHAHWDHIIGFNFFAPLFLEDRTLFIPNHRFSGLRVQEIVASLMKPPFFPITLKDTKADLKFMNHIKSRFSIGSVEIDTIPLSHPGGGLGYRFTEANRTFVILTDNELGFNHPENPGRDAYIDFAGNADLLFHDAEFTADEYASKQGWGHSPIPEVLSLAVAAGVQKLGLFHLNHTWEDNRVDAITDACRKTLLDENAGIDCFAVPCGMTITL